MRIMAYGSRTNKSAIVTGGRCGLDVVMQWGASEFNVVQRSLKVTYMWAQRGISCPSTASMAANHQKFVRCRVRSDNVRRRDGNQAAATLI
jgi:hypothetical protein